MRLSTTLGKLGFITRDLFPIYAAITAAAVVIVINAPRWAPPPDDSPVDKAVTGTYTGWKAVASSPQARMETQGAAVNGGRLYLLGGYYQINPKYTGSTRCDYYQPATNTWTRVADMPHAVTHAGVANDGRMIWLAGGYPLRSDGWQNFASTTVYAYDTVANTWAEITPLPQPRGAGAMVIVGRTLHFISGVDLKRADHTDHWTLAVDQPGHTWQVAPPLPAPRNHAAAVAFNNRIYVAGGQQGYNDAFPSASFFIFDVASNKWTAGPNMPTPRSHNSAASFVYDGRIVVAAGETVNGRVLPDVIAYDIPTNKWLALPKLPAGRHSPLIQPVGNTIVATDGAYPPTIETTTWVSVGQ